MGYLPLSERGKSRRFTAQDLVDHLVVQSNLALDFVLVVEVIRERGVDLRESLLITVGDLLDRLTMVHMHHRDVGPADAVPIDARPPCIVSGVATMCSRPRTVIASLYSNSDRGPCEPRVTG